MDQRRRAGQPAPAPHPRAPPPLSPTTVEYDASDVEKSIEAYAQVMAELASAGDAREAVLAHHGLDEARWEAIDNDWQSQLSEAMDQEPDDDGIPEILSLYAAAYENAQRSIASPISLDQFAMVTRLLDASGDVRASLSKVGVTLADYVRGSEHWTRQLAGDPELERRFREVLRSGDQNKI
jgi:hypothetical protein